MTRCFFLGESYCPVHVGRPLLREVGSLSVYSEQIKGTRENLYGGKTEQQTVHSAANRSGNILLWIRARDIKVN
jgi:hypothetical protein